MFKRIALLLLFTFAFHTICNATSYLPLSSKHFSDSAAIDTQNRFTANFIQEVWPEEIETVSAEFSSECYDKKRNISYILSLYNSSNQLVSVSRKNSAMAANSIEHTSLSSPHAQIADTAKIYVWDFDTQKPLRSEKTLCKIKNALTIFLDAENGNDSNSGSFQAPLKTLEMARRNVRRKKYELSEDQNAIYVILKNGEYTLKQALSLGESDGGSEKFNLIYTALERHDAVISGSVDVSGFSLYDIEKNIYRAYVGNNVQSRHFFADGIRCPRASRTTPPEGYQYTNGTMTSSETDFLNYKHIEDLEFCFEVNWMHDRCRVDSITQLSDGRIQFNMSDNTWKYMTAKSHYKSAQPTYLENAYEFLDVEGEWYLDTREGYVYYKPRFFEDINSTRFTMPVSEDLLTVSSTSSPVKNITFRGIHFTQTTWNFPTTNRGLCITQNESYRGSDGNTTFMDAAIDVKNSDNVHFLNCKFSKTGKTALKYSNGASNSCIIGNEFSDMSAGALTIGGVTDAERNPENTSLAVKNVRVENNFIHGAAVDIKSNAALSAGFPIDTSISHNEIYNTGYSGIHTGWGWDSTAPAATENFIISNNYIHKVLNSMLYDGGAVYMLGHTNGSKEKPNQLTGNYVEDIRKPFGALYPDQGSSYWQISDNVVDLSKQKRWIYGTQNQNSMDSRWTHMHMSTINHIYFGINYSTTYEYYNRGSDISYKTPNVFLTANWPEEALAIICKSGVQTMYRDNFVHGFEDFSGNDVSVEKGEELLLSTIPVTSKKRYYHPDSFTCYAVIADDGVLEIRDEKIFASKIGETNIYLNAIDNDMLTTHAVTVTVTR